MMVGVPCDSSDVKATGKRSAGKPHAAFDEGEPANATRIQLVRHRQTKGAETDRLDLRTREPALYSTGLNFTDWQLTPPFLRHPLKGEGLTPRRSEVKPR